MKETDLFIHAKLDVSREAKEFVLKYRGYIETYINQNPAFLATLTPINVSEMNPAIISAMGQAGQNAGVGPMAAVAGAIAEFVGLELLQFTDEIIIENGGDIFLKTDKPVTVGVFAGDSPLSYRLGFKVDTAKAPIAVCTSSGTIGHSLSKGTADAVCVKSTSCPVADAAATAIGNHVKKRTDIKSALEFGKNIKGVEGVIIIKKEAVGFWGDLEVIGL